MGNKKQIDQWNQRESEVDTHLTQDEGDPVVTGETMLVLVNDTGSTGYPCVKKNYMCPYLTPHTNMNSRWAADPNVTVETIRTFEKNRTTSL